MATKVDASGLDELKLDMEKMADRMDGLADVTKAAAQEFETMKELDVFGQEQSPQGEPWEELHPTTINKRRGKHTSVANTSQNVQMARKGSTSSTSRGTKSRKRKSKGSEVVPFAGKILQDTTLLKRSTFAKGEGAKVVFGVSGAATEYAGTHQFGSQRGTHNVPARPFLPVDDQGSPEFKSGPALRWIEKLQNRVTNWVLYGIKSNRKPKG